MSQAKRDENRITTLMGVSSVDGTTPTLVAVNPVNGRVLVDLPSGSGTVTDVSVVSANGFAGTVATSTTTPAITLSTTITGVLKGNGTAISAATAGTDYTTPTGVENLTNKTLDNTNTVTLKDTLFTLQDNTDTTKQAQFELSNITTGTTRTYTLPNASATIAVTNVTQTFSGAQTFSASTGNFGSSTATSTYQLGYGATTTGNTKTINIGTSGASGSTTTITIGSSTSGATTNTTIYGTVTNLPTGQLALGTSDAMTVHGASITSQLQINSDTQAVAEAHTHSATAGAGAVWYGARSRGTTAAPTIVQSGDAVLQQYAVAYDGTDYEQLGYTAWEVDGTPGANDMPGRFIVAVTPDGGFTPAEALRISQDKSALFAGTLSVGTTNSITAGTIELGAASDTTLARVSAGVMSVEGVRVITSSSTTANTILKNNGTTFVASTETYAAPGTSGNVMTSDGTNWTSAAPAGSVDYSCRVYQTGATALTTSWVACAFAAENFDTDTMHDNATNNTRITFTHAGKYCVGGLVSTNNNSVTGARIKLNGTTVIAMQKQGNSGNPEGACVSTIYSFSAADYVELEGYAQTFNSSGDAQTNFWAYRIAA